VWRGSSTGGGGRLGREGTGVLHRAGKRGRGPQRRVAPATNDEGERTREEGASSTVGGRAPWARPPLYRKGEGERERAGEREKRSAMASRRQ
jgi:hypothetical protein